MRIRFYKRDLVPVSLALAVTFSMIFVATSAHSGGASHPHGTITDVAQVTGGNESENCHNCRYKNSERFSQDYEINENGKGLGCILESVDKNEAVKIALASLPSSYDWRDYGVMTSVKNQGGCGSCVAFGTIGAFEAVIRVEGGPSSDLSEAHLFFCGGGGCENGWYISSALDYLLSYGTPDESCFPYQDYNMPCSNTCSDWQDRVEKISNWNWVASDRPSIKSALVGYGPLVAGFDVYEDFVDYNGGVYHYDGTSPYVGGHCVTLVGYNEDQDYWICKNSWGPSWGENGYFRIGYGECGIENSVAYLEVVLGAGVTVSISPDNQSARYGENLEYTVTVTNTGDLDDNYILVVSDNILPSWNPTLDDNWLVVPRGDNRTTTLRVAIPKSVLPCTEDNITVTAISQENENVSDNASCMAHVIPPKVEVSLVTLYKVGLDLDVYLENGSKLVVKFYTYMGDNQGENVVWENVTPARVTLLENVPHPSGLPIEITTLLLTTDNTAEVISEIASFTVRQSDLKDRFFEILGGWFKYPELQDAFKSEVRDILSQWFKAPP